MLKCLIKAIVAKIGQERARVKRNLVKAVRAG